jgi:hypothetical protein
MTSDDTEPNSSDQAQESPKSSVKTGGDGGDQTDQTNQNERLKALFQWAEHALEAADALKLLRDAKTREELDGIKFDPDDPELIMRISCIPAPVRHASSTSSTLTKSS